MTEEELRRQRIEKIARLREAGVPPYPERYERTHRLAEAARLPEGTKVRVCGRMTGFRAMGKLSFAHIADVEGRLQVALTDETMGREQHRSWAKLLDLGDFVGVEGELFRTKTGEITVKVATLAFLGKALRPLPEKWHGVADRELCYRQRYLDLVSNDETRKRFRVRTRIVSAIRRFLEENGFEEVETPVLTSKPSGALARPFATHHRALDIDVFLRIAPETYLKRLVVGGYDRVYEFARCFRNEGMDPSHLQDFTMLEFYAAFWNYEDNMEFTRKLVQRTLQEVFGTLTVEIAGAPLDFSGEWPRLGVAEVVREHSGIDLARHPDAASLAAEIARRGIEVEDAAKLGRGALIDQIYKKTARPRLRGPVFLVGHPIELSPLARKSDADPARTDRFQLLVAGWEIVNAYSELVDPLDQRARLEEQSRLRAAGDDEAMALDEDYLLAMEYGMPPISGWGMGIDRFVTLVTGQENLRDVVFFPLMRPPESDAAREPTS
ncbi:MAG: lysine--tRNA ligase [Planctomycetes bacterium]|nr:lysine--tRNA ligase [Planctomycetota bacterium]